jgi:hypothetical protein
MRRNHTRQGEATEKERRMKKMFAVGATAALMLAASSPAFAQDAVAVDDGVAQGGDVLFGDASQFQFAAQGQFGDAVADDGGVAVVASDQGITQNQLNGGFGDLDDFDDFDLDGLDDDFDEDDDNDGVFDVFE